MNQDYREQSKMLQYQLIYNSSILGCCKSIEKAKVRLNGIQLPITQLLQNRFQYNLQHRVHKSFLHHNVKANFLFERKNQTKKMVEKRLNSKVESWASFLSHSYHVYAKQNGLQIYRIAIQRKVLLKVCENPAPNRSGISDLRQCSTFEVQKREKS